MEASRMETKFEFIVSTPVHDAMIQQRTKQFVRKYVMRPYKKHKSPRRAIVLQEQALAEYLANRQNQLGGPNPFETYSFQAGSPRSAAALLGASRPNPFGRYPIKMGPKEHELVHHIWASRQVVFQPFRDYWFSLGMMDAAAMHSVIANAAMHRKLLHNSPEDDAVEVNHHFAAISSINQRIADSKQNITDEMLGAILGLMCHDYLALRFELCRYHVNGFQRMLDLRGGLTSIEAVTSIRLSLFWIEHNISVAQDIVPQFAPPFNLLEPCPFTADQISHGLLHRDEAVKSTGVSHLMSIEMLDIFTSISVLIVSLTAKSLSIIAWDDPLYPGFAFYPTLYKLLAVQALSNKKELKDGVQEMCRLGCILFLAQVRRRFGISPIVTIVQESKLEELLESNCMLWSEELDHIRIWSIVIAGCTVSTEAGRTWAAKALTRSRVSSVSQRWDDVMDIVRSMWWIDEIFSWGCSRLQNEYNEAVVHM